MMELKLNSYNIFEMGESLSKTLHENGIEKESQLIINVDKDELRKIDEDLYYRNNPEGKDFIPSDNEIIVKFKKLIILIKSQDGEEGNDDKTV